jgi:hypothetical protein
VRAAPKPLRWVEPFASWGGGRVRPLDTSDGILPGSSAMVA